MSYVIITDTGSDISRDKLAEWKVQCVDLIFRFEGEDRSYVQDEMPVNTFYRRMRDGACAKTAAANIEDFYGAFEPVLQQGQDILYLAFSSGLSTTAATSHIAAADLAERYPERSIITVDSLCASAGEGLFVYLAVKRRDEGKSAREVADEMEALKPKLCHWFTVDDLVYLKRGGRVSAAAALAGGVLGIKPVLHVDDEGHLINMMKVRGRKQSIKALADKYEELADKNADGTIFISHADCPEDAEALDAQLFQRFGVRASLITDIGPVIGAHSGPGTLALFFLGTHR